MADDPRDTPDSSPAATDPSQPSAGDAAEVEALRRERDELYDRLLRKTAEFDNYRKRIERERREQADQAVTDLLLDLLLVADDFELALITPGGKADTPYRKGIELIHAKLQDVLRKRQVQPIDAVGHDFNPEIHQAVAHDASPDHREGEVIQELRRGYMRGDRLLRPSMVKVAKA